MASASSVAGKYPTAGTPTLNQVGKAAFAPRNHKVVLYTPTASHTARASRNNRASTGPHGPRSPLHTAAPLRSVPRRNRTRTRSAWFTHQDEATPHPSPRPARRQRRRASKGSRSARGGKTTRLGRRICITTPARRGINLGVRAMQGRALPQLRRRRGFGGGLRGGRGPRRGSRL